MGLIGTMKNADKVIGPVLGGLLVHWQDFSWMLWTMAGLPTFGAVGVLHLSPVSSNSAATGFRKALGIEGLHPFKPCFCSLRTDAHWRFEVMVKATSSRTNLDWDTNSQTIDIKQYLTIS